MPTSDGRRWIKLWVKECLMGTLREELSPEERSVWYDFLLLAGNSRVSGVICANEDTPLSLRRVSQILNAPEELVQRCVILFEHQERISVDKAGLIHILNWGRYQHSDYDRQKVYREARQIEAESTETKAPHGEFKNVLLTATEYGRLQEQLGAEAGPMIEKLSAYLASRHKKYKSHYATILNWHRRDREEARGKTNHTRSLPKSYTPTVDYPDLSA